MCFSPSGADTAKWTNRLSLVVWKQASQVTPVHQKLGNSHPKYKVFHHELLPKLTLWGDALASKKSDLQTEKAIVLPLKEENRPRQALV